MRKLLALLVAIVVAVIGLIWFTDAHESSALKKHEAVPHLVVGVVLNSSMHDGGWSESHYRAFETARRNFPISVLYAENVVSDSSSEPIFRQLIQRGAKVVFATSYGYGPTVMKLSRQYPDVRFYQAAGERASENVATYFGRIYQMRYLAGIVAGKQTKTGDIGYVASFPICEVRRGVNAFALGVRSVNPRARVHLYWTHDWSNYQVEKRIAQDMVKKYPVDVLAYHQDTRAVADFAEAHGIWSIGYDMDLSKLYPQRYLTSVVWNWEPFYRKVFREYLQGKSDMKAYWYGDDYGIVDLAQLSSNVVAGTAQEVDRRRRKIKDGTWDVFYGPIRDNHGRTRVRDGESLSDEYLLNRMDWLVEGVVEENHE